MIVEAMGRASWWQKGGDLEFDLPIHRKWWQLWRPRVVGYRHVRIPGVTLAMSFNPPLDL